MKDKSMSLTDLPIVGADHLRLQVVINNWFFRENYLAILRYLLLCMLMVPPSYTFMMGSFGSQLVCLHSLRSTSTKVDCLFVFLFVYNSSVCLLAVLVFKLKLIDCNLCFCYWLINPGTVEVGDIVQINKTVGSPHELAIVSHIFFKLENICNIYIHSICACICICIIGMN